MKTSTNCEVCGNPGEDHRVCRLIGKPQAVNHHARTRARHGSLPARIIKQKITEANLAGKIFTRDLA